MAPLLGLSQDDVIMDTPLTGRSFIIYVPMWIDMIATLVGTSFGSIENPPDSPRNAKGLM